MSTEPTPGPGTEEAAEEPLNDGYGNDTGFAQEAENADEANPEATAEDRDKDDTD